MGHTMFNFGDHSFPTMEPIATHGASLSDVDSGQVRSASDK